MNPALDSRASFEAWYADWQRSTWTPLHGNDEMPAHWNTSAKRLMELAWQAAIASRWQPIATAPRHGRILVAGTEIGACVASAGWDNETPEIIRWEVVNGITVHPTHWQPITPPIAALAAKETT